MTAKAVLYLLITLLIGFGLGMITDRALLTIRQSRMDHHPPEMNIIDHMIGSLELEPHQIDSITPVLEDFFMRSDSTRRLIMEQAGAGMDTLRLNLLPYLTEDQIEKMDELGLFRPGPWRREGPPGKPRIPGPPPAKDRPPGRPRPGNPPYR